MEITKINADVKSFQAVLLKRYRAQITAVKNITDIQAQIRTDEEIDKEYPTPKKEIVSPKAEEKKAEEIGDHCNRHIVLHVLVIE